MVDGAGARAAAVLMISEMNFVTVVATAVATFIAHLRVRSGNKIGG
jgi:hypothetical protein